MNNNYNPARHHQQMMKKYPLQIKQSIDNTEIYTTTFKMPKASLNKVDHIFMNTDSVTALQEIYRHDQKICILNYASYRYPGGGYMSGSRAQEEALCYESTLYEVISDKKFTEYYQWNNQHLNNSLYENRALYTPDIIFIKDSKEMRADVITCAAPNKNASHTTPLENSEVLKDRIQYIIDIIYKNKINIFITGAYGCGVFGQNPMEVANLWKNASYGKNIKTIIYAVPFDNVNSKVFQEIFTKSS